MTAALKKARPARARVESSHVRHYLVLFRTVEDGPPEPVPMEEAPGGGHEYETATLGDGTALVVNGGRRVADREDVADQVREAPSIFGHLRLAMALAAAVSRSS